MYKFGQRILFTEVEEKLHRLSKELFYDPVERVFYILLPYVLYGEKFSESYYTVLAISSDIQYFKGYI